MKGVQREIVEYNSFALGGAQASEDGIIDVA
jgi:hypothetical protein